MSPQLVIPALPHQSAPSVDSTPPGRDKTEDADKVTVQVLTPPPTNSMAGPVVSGGEINQPRSSPAVEPEVTEDPFTATPNRQAQAVANPAAPALSQISAIIAANLSHANSTGVEPPREDRLSEPVNAHNCQGLFLKEAKLFVANLSNLRTNDQLEISVAATFDQFGPCVVIIKRDRNHQPMGFVQYHLIQGAEVAMANANGSLIDGRVIRLEWASAKQELIISLLTNEPLTEAIVREALAGRGPIATIRPTGPATAYGNGSTAWLVGFVYYADCREAIRLMRDNQTYRVVPAPKEARQAPYPLAPPRTPQGELYLDNDSRSVFLGSLPNSVTEEEIRELFAYLGTITSCNIITKPLTIGGMNTFAFLEFKYASDAASAANTSQFLRGEPIRVERKQYAQRRASRIAASQRLSIPHNKPYLQYIQQYPTGPTMSPYHPATPYHVATNGLSVSNYNTTPPAAVCMGPYPPFASPAPRMRHYQQYQGPPQISPSMHYGNTGPYGHEQGHVHMNAIAEEHDGCVFD